ncbi:MAG: DNA polymerase I [Clostridia bacterium]|nr:DNA polymerase I [Clostridia bacterium]
MRDTFLIVDGNSLMHRAFHALPLMDYNGVYTNAVHGFLNMLLRCIRERAPRYCAVAFDEHAPTFRHTEYAEYKAGRMKTPDELRGQFDIIKEVLSAMGFGVLSLTGYEADDILGTLSSQCAARDLSALLLTGDRDALQLVSDDVTLLLTRKGISDIEECTPERVKELWGVTPAQITDLKGLMGDSSDNIPGIPGVGEKTAVKLLAEYETLENVLAHGDEIKGKLGEKVRGNADSARFSKWLATIRRDAPIDVHYDECDANHPEKGVGVLYKYGLNSLAQRLGGEKTAEVVTEEKAREFADWQEITAEAVPALIKGQKEIAAYMSEDTLSVAAGSGRMKAQLGGQVALFDLPGMNDGDPVAACRDIWNDKVITHDGKRLLHTLKEQGHHLPEIVFDTMLAAYVLNPQEKSYHLSTFADADASGVLSLYEKQRAEMEAAKVTELYEKIELPLLRVLYDMEETGFPVDIAVLREIGDTLTKRENELREQIYALCNVGEFNVNSPKQLGEVLFEKLGLPAGRKTSKGYSTDAETLEKLRDKHPAIECILEYRQVAKLNGTYIDALIRKTESDGRIHTFFDQTGTATGRISSAEPNLQNIPVRTPMGREIRRAFVASPGCVLVDADYSQIELRILAHFSGDAAMVDAFRKGQDIHTRTAAEVAGIAMEEVTPTLRANAKAVNFGLVYGISDFGLARNTGMSRKEAADFIEKYFATYPGVKGFMSRAVAEGYDTGEARTVFGRVRKLPELKASNANVRNFGERAAMNTPVQGTAADIIKLAMVRVHQALKDGGFKAKLILQVHDELIIEAPENEAEQVAKLLKDCMESVIELNVPLVAEVKTGRSWYETK